MKRIIGKLLFWFTINIMIFMKHINANQMHIQPKDVHSTLKPIYGHFPRWHQLG